MDQMEEFLRELQVQPGNSEDSINTVEMRLHMKFPADYREFLLRSNGVSGFIGKSYLLIWPLESMEEINRIASVDEFAPGLILFGSDGGGMSYAFDARSPSLSLVEVPSIGMSIQEITFCGRTFVDFLKYLYYK